MVKTAMNVREKAKESGSDPHLAMLIYEGLEGYFRDPGFD